MIRKRLFHRSRLFRSILRMPTPEDRSLQLYPIAETYNEVSQERGFAYVDIQFVDGEPWTYFNIIQSCGDTITHWRWADTEVIARARMWMR